MRTYIAILLFSVSCCMNYPSVFATQFSQWEKTEATIEMVKENINNLSLENTVLGALVQATGKPLAELLEKDKTTLTSFIISYNIIKDNNESLK